MTMMTRVDEAEQRGGGGGGAGLRVEQARDGDREEEPVVGRQQCCVRRGEALARLEGRLRRVRREHAFDEHVCEGDVQPVRLRVAPIAVGVDGARTGRGRAGAGGERVRAEQTADLARRGGGPTTQQLVEQRKPVPVERVVGRVVRDALEQPQRDADEQPPRAGAQHRARLRAQERTRTVGPVAQPAAAAGSRRRRPRLPLGGGALLVTQRVLLLVRIVRVAVVSSAAGEATAADRELGGG
eukprot:CAMPEP_0179867878 /NCGR_PEP_ID=MMETSP0982-20121206/18467_1 /TAXON_ID=483367 /ORGANISM="non described non described, Strain CCMP 2436" /LENGTH=240 /DNA_ID=CAMNT_0021757391 /DNA_START=43 /DNA_END=761 /DNA_ORIENTATION=+